MAETSNSLTTRVQSVFNEPGCAVSQEKTDGERKLGCAIKFKQKPGATAGGCAFDGAKIALQPVTDVAHLVHGPISCEGNSWDNRNCPSSGPQTFRTSFTTDISEFDIIYGGEKKLFKAIREIIERYDPPAVFVYQTCVTAMIGDDVETVCKTASERFSKPVIPVIIPGFAGVKNLGNKLAGETLLDHVIGTGEPPFTTLYDINIIAEFNVAGDLWQIKPLFDQLGIRILTCITGDARYEQLTWAHRAKVSMMVCSRAMVNVGRKLKERYGIPYFEGSFFGIGDMSDTLRQISRLLVEQGAPEDLLTRTEALIAVEEARAWTRLEQFRERLQGKRVLLITGGVKSWSMVSALQSTGLEVIGTSVKKSTAEDKERIIDIMGSDEHMVSDMKPREMYDALKEARADIMLSGSRSQFVALKAKMPWIDVNQERHQSYSGYEGMVRLVQEIDRELYNPLWEQVRKPAPWDLEEGA